MPLNHRQIGNQAEDLACKYLENLNYKILDRNFTIVGGEIDIIAEKDGVLVFVEVKARFTHQYGLPEEAVSYHKVKFLRRSISVYINRKHLFNKSCRVDLFCIDYSESISNPRIEIIENIIES